MELTELNEKFEFRHIGPSESDTRNMLKIIGVSSLDELIEQTFPKRIRLDKPIKLEKPLTEFEYLNHIDEVGEKNKLFKNYIGMGYNSSILPSVIRRNILENPGWYTQYTPYQAEISQGRLEALLNFQTMIIDLTGLPIANASLLDEGTAAAEAMIMANSLKKNKAAKKIFVSENCFPQTIEVVFTRALPLDIEVVVGDIEKAELNEEYFGAIVQYPDAKGDVIDYTEYFAKNSAKGLFNIVAADILSLALLKTPAEMGADIAVGSTQRFGIPLGYGGPHAAYFAVKEEFKRSIPGRIIGLSIDSNGNPGYRMALQTREQHIRREKATSNICTSQALLAIMAGFYAAYHGPEGIKAIAGKIHKLASSLNDSLKKLGFKQENKIFFDSLIYDFSSSKSQIVKIRKLAEKERVNFNYLFNNKIGISINETTGVEDINKIIEIFAKANNRKAIKANKLFEKAKFIIPEALIRKSEYFIHPVFNRYRSEAEMTRYMKNLEKKDLSLTGSMIPLGSCTMKLNAATEMFAITKKEFADLHPFAPADQTEGYKIIFEKLGKALCEITGFDAISFQPNSGAQGEYASLMTIREYFKNRKETNRNIALIPASAHGTNPASAAMAGFKVIVVNCDERGNIDLNDLKAKAEEYKTDLAVFMVTYPSTHGVFEEEIVEMCETIHKNGGQVFMDGANMNAQVGLTSPKKIGADICHLNLHKTFAIPHGGGGPGAGPIAAAKHLIPYLPSHKLVSTGGKKGITAVSSAPFGSALILLISYAYIRMMGAEGLTNATKYSILNANYIKSKLSDKYKTLYTGINGKVAHEMIFDVREHKQKCGIDVEDIAKRLMDYGFHAPTVSFPVPGTLMVEPTESESKYELDRFCEALSGIYDEIKEIENGSADIKDNLLKNAPHTALEIAKDDWKRPYSREKAAFPVKALKDNKFWPAVGRVDNAYGDRNLVCACPSISEY